jgi:hypothetical protein
MIVLKKQALCHCYSYFNERAAGVARLPAGPDVPWIPNRNAYKPH